jgi:hypothetical protein
LAEPICWYLRTDRRGTLPASHGASVITTGAENAEVSPLTGNPNETAPGKDYYGQPEHAP